MTMKAYAVKYKLSLFNVVKLVKSGKLKSETVMEEGREKVYVIMDDHGISGEKEVKTGMQHAGEEGLEVRVIQLESEVQRLRREMDALKKDLVINSHCR